MKKSIFTILLLSSIAGAETALTMSGDIPSLQSEVKTPDISGLQIVANTMPQFSMQIGNRVDGSSQFAAEYVFGNVEYSGFFNVTANYPILAEDEKSLTLKGQVSFEDSHILRDQNFLVWISGTPQAQAVQLNSPIVLTFVISKDSNSASITREVNGVCQLTPNNFIDLESPTQIDGVYVTGQAPIFEALIPEPSTATLSLLALAGLCTRRRRR